MRFPLPGRHLRSLVLAGLLARALAAAPAPYVWRNAVIGGGGFVSGLVYHPTTPGLLYARTDVGGAYRWESHAHRWQPLNDDLDSSDAQLLGVVSLALDPQDARRVYLASGSYLAPAAQPAALLRSDDQGATWRRTPLPFHLGGNAAGRNTGERLQVDPHDGHVLLLGTNHDGLWRSADAGATWSRLAGFPAAGVTLVVFAPDSPAAGGGTRTIYVGVDDLAGPSLLVSHDAGAHWAAVPGAPGHLIPQHAALAANGSLFVAYANGLGPNDVTAGGVWMFMPASGEWTDISPVAPNPANGDMFGYAGLALDPRHPGTILVSTLDRWQHHDEVFRSTDGGRTWKPLLARGAFDHSFAPYTRKLVPHWIGTVAIDPFHPATAWFVTGYGAWATDHVDGDGAIPWAFADAGLEETVPLALVSPPDGVHLLSAVGDIGGFRHETLDRSAAAGAYDRPYSTNESIAFAARHPEKIVRTHSGPTHGAVSTDDGITWKEFATAPAAAARRPGTIAMSADGRRLVWARGGAAYVSADDGVTWRETIGGTPATAGVCRLVPLADSEDANRFYLYDATSGRVYVSTDGGEHFSPGAELAPAGGALGAPRGRAREIWAPTPAGLFRSVDGGLHFERLPGIDAADHVGFGAPAPTDSPAPRARLQDDRRDSRVRLAQRPESARGATPPYSVFVHGKVAGDTGLFRSDDGGKMWIKISDPRHNFGYILSVTGDPRVFGRVYLATGGRGIIYGDPDR